MNKAKFLAAASVIALGFAANANAAGNEGAKNNAAEGKVKCEFTQTEDAKNDCATAKHSCAGKAKKGDKAWKFAASEKECADWKGTVVKEEKKH